MEKTKYPQRAHRIFKKVFENDSVILQIDTTANDVDGWDSPLIPPWLWSRKTFQREV